MAFATNEIALLSKVVSQERQDQVELLDRLTPIRDMAFHILSASNQSDTSLFSVLASFPIWLLSKLYPTSTSGAQLLPRLAALGSVVCLLLSALRPTLFAPRSAVISSVAIPLLIWCYAVQHIDVDWSTGLEMSSTATILLLGGIQYMAVRQAKRRQATLTRKVRRKEKEAQAFNEGVQMMKVFVNSFLEGNELRGSSRMVLRAAR